ncbi:MAG TPA: VOC family protein [Blastocatellia bacterium]|nr:VOC family protein [Blastocatellia bacterium]
MLRNAAFHHVELPCDDLEVAERFYTIVLGAQVYMRRDASRRSDVPFAGTIAEAETKGFQIDATYLKIREFRIGFLKRAQQHNQHEIDHLAFVIDDEELTSLARRLTEYKIEVVDQKTESMMIRDPFGLMLELWPRSVLGRMGLI